MENVAAIDRSDISRSRSESNIKRMFISGFLSSMFFDRSIWIVYLIERGISPIQVGLLESILHLSIIFLEIPTGIIADIFGRRISLIFSRAFAAAYAVGMLMTHQFSVFSILFILLGCSETFTSGADLAFLYDSDQRNHEQDRFVEVNSRYYSMVIAGMGVGMLLGGFLKLVSWEFLYIALAAVQIISIIPLLFTSEEKSGIQRRFSLSEVVRSTYLCLKNKTLLLLIIGIVFFQASINVIYLFVPMWFSEIGFSATTISVLFALDAGVSIIVYRYASRLSQCIGIQKMILILPALALVFLVLLPVAPLLLIPLLFVIINNSSVLFHPYSNTLINSRIDSQMRATLLSVISFLNSLFIILFFPLSTASSGRISSEIVVSLFAIAAAISLISLGRFVKLNRCKGIYG